MLTEGQLWPALRSYWHPVALSNSLADKPLSVRLLDERIALFRVQGRAVCLRDLCIHRGTPLSLGWVDGERIVCAYHGWNYNPCGVCVKIPAVPDRPIPEKARVPAYRCEERYGLVWVCLANHHAHSRVPGARRSRLLSRRGWPFHLAVQRGALHGELRRSGPFSVGS